jgi:hypothetical protein
MAKLFLCDRCHIPEDARNPNSKQAVTLNLIINGKTVIPWQGTVPNTVELCGTCFHKFEQWINPNPTLLLPTNTGVIGGF